MMDNFTQILQPIPVITKGSSTSSHFGGATPFKVQVNFDIPLFKSNIDADALDKWLSMLEGYFDVHNFSNEEKIISTPLKAMPHVKDWWDTYCEQNSTDVIDIFGGKPTWASFVESIKEKYYHVGNYDDQYTKWTTLQWEMDQTVPKYTKNSHTLCTKRVSISYSE